MASMRHDRSTVPCGLRTRSITFNAVGFQFTIINICELPTFSGSVARYESAWLELRVNTLFQFRERLHGHKLNASRLVIGRAMRYLRSAKVSAMLM